MLILVAEDDKKLNEGIVLALKNNDTAFSQCYSCKEIIAVLETEIPELLILDINFPDGSGLDILKLVRRRKLLIRVIVLTANSMETDIVTGLELGADDYITKPFSLMVLRARVNVQLRNAEFIGNTELKSQAGRAVQGENCIAIDGFVFDFEHMIFKVEHEVIELSKTEQKLLRVLVENRGITLLRERLIELVWSGDSEYVDEHALTVTVKRLRDKLGDGRAEKSYIKTVYGIGYTWVV